MPPRRGDRNGPLLRRPLRLHGGRTGSVGDTMGNQSQVRGGARSSVPPARGRSSVDPSFHSAAAGRYSAPTTCQAPCSACGYGDDQDSSLALGWLAPHDIRSRPYGDGRSLLSQGPMVFAVGAVWFHHVHSRPLGRFSLCRQQIHASWTGLARISKAGAIETVRGCSKFTFSVCSPHPSALSRDSASGEPEDSRVEGWLVRDLEDT